MDEQKENRFLLSQLLERAVLRIKECRALSIDLLSINTSKSNRCPYIFTGDPTAFDISEKDIEEFLSLEEEDEMNKSYWNSLKKYQKEKNNNSNIIVSQDIKDLFFADITSIKELKTLEKFVTEKLRSSHVNMDYWESVRQELTLTANRLELIELHEKLLERRRTDTVINSLEEINGLLVKEDSTPYQLMMKSFESDGFDTNPLAIKMFRDDSCRRLSGHHREYPFNELVNHEGVRIKSVGGGGDIPPSLPLPLSSLTKPRFYNRAIKIYDWNKYNQAHYTYHNPPPMITTGYRFHVFYPRLIGRRDVVPKYILRSLVMTAEDRQKQNPPNAKGFNHSDYQLITFTTEGKVYQDITFKIEKYPWDCNYKNGFLYKFEHGILKLHFSLKRQRRIRYPR